MKTVSDGEKGLETLLAWQKSLAFSVAVCKQVIPHRIINGYITFLKRTKQGEGEPGHNLHETPGLYNLDMDEEGVRDQ